MTDTEWELAVRREQLFRERHASAVAHRTVLRLELEPLVGGLKPMQARLGVLLAERKKLDAELEFYRGKPLPAHIAAANDANVAQLTGLADAFRRSQESIDRMAANHSCQTATFGPLWTGGAPGISACHRPACLPS